ncbi:uncharacterized protein EI97DRAFT_435000 [Westerdykella ornata]|uniref:Uncharacterized protein n=1 Tax=Westerdykella ornata TaxID=318751 RepID=A0A6A6JDT8_WESOR|nr:uncharacterized protein EI97DRAFT_435000 [Westerdykella ornata]KAF2274447.1 hypothetical protein EI97DRAFT_435000 [Westerdykella ornata]
MPTSLFIHTENRAPPVQGHGRCGLTVLPTSVIDAFVPPPKGSWQGTVEGAHRAAWLSGAILRYNVASVFLYAR